MTEIPTYDWKYLICPHGQAAWARFAEHGIWPTHPASNRDFDCTHVAESIAAHVGADYEVTICLEDRGGTRFEVDVAREQVVHYEAVTYRDMGKSTPSDEAKPI